MTQLELAKKEKTTLLMEKVAREESLPKEFIREGVERGEIVILKNRRGNPLGIGKGLRTKVNANLGTSPELCEETIELEKLKVAEEAGTDTIMDLSTGGDLDRMRRLFLEKTSLPLGTVPIYQAAIETIREKGALIQMEPKKIFQVIEKHAKDGVDFITVHCGVTRKALEKWRGEGRLTDVVSRGGAFHITWMVANNKENPLFENFDELLAIAKEYDVVLSLGDGFRPGSLKDATDRSQVEELLVLAELLERAKEEGVQAMIEGPGHLPLQEIEANVLLEKKLCKGAPFYVLGPLVTDVALGYDHIAGAIGGALAASYGADFLCYVTPAEHLRLPTPEDVREGVIASRIAAHAADIAKGIRGAQGWDDELSYHRKKRNWGREISLSIDPKRARELWEKSKPHLPDVCTMCGEFCALKLVEEWLKIKK